uniref:uncharacterized protein LOC105350895 n=1 Tax=Fragaria vesca subsp. vesca TaxID=101020 RepID=UPI0005CB1B08|nr:PREDICTED: uncharacterized protein LOC105350895 [Fragaria vesca subsp. vesca]
MMQKILVKLHIHCDKCRTKAFKIAANTPGVNRVSIEGADRDHLEVIGNGVDSVCLTRALRKKLGFANIISVEQVGESRCNYSEEERPTAIQYCATTSSYSSHFQHPQIGYPMYYHHEPTPDNCSIM